MSRTKKIRPLAYARPRLRRVDGMWHCSDGVVKATGHSFQGAYQAWLTKAIQHAMKSQGIDYKGEVTAVKPAYLPAAPAEPPKVVTVTHSPEQGTKTYINGKEADLPEPFKGEVTVVKGVQARPALKLPQMLQINAERARAAQGPLRSLSGIKEAA